MSRNLLVTGGAGFIGSHFVDYALAKGNQIIIVDSLTYAADLSYIKHLNSTNLTFIKGNILDSQLISQILDNYKITALINFAAESHVDNSINNPENFIQTNIVGTYQLLNCCYFYYQKLTSNEQANFRYIQVSTDEVYGSINLEDQKFTEQSAILPNSPYSASKASADLLVRAWHETYNLPVIITNCSNNYGPRQFPEKLIPKIINLALNKQRLPIYGDGKNIRDWIHVEDHCAGIYLALINGKIGQKYLFGGDCERTNLELVTNILGIINGLNNQNFNYYELIEFVLDRLGHDFRYAIDDQKAQTELGFKRKYTLNDGLRSTVKWYIDNPNWFLNKNQV